MFRNFHMNSIGKKLNILVLLFFIFTYTTFIQAQEIDFTSDEKQWLNDHSEIKIAINDSWPPMNFVDNSGNPQGIGVDFIEAINKRLGGRLKIIPGSWADIYEKVKNKQLDALMDITPKKDREPFFNFTKPYVNIPHAIIARKADRYYNSLGELDGKILAVESGFYIIKILEEKYPEINLKEYASTSDALDAVSKGEADAYAGNRAVAFYITRNELLNNLQIQGKLTITSSLNSIGVRKDWPILATILDKVLDSLSQEEINSIYTKWGGLDETKPKFKALNLTEEEKTWIRENPVIRLASTPDWPPFEERTASGDYIGITADFVQLATERAGLKIEPVFEKWPLELEMLKRGELDLAPGLGRTKEREEFLVFTRSFIKMYEVLLIHADQIDITSMEDIAGKTVAVESGFRVHEILKDDFPDTKLFVVDNALEALKKVSSGEADAYIGNQVVSSYLIKSNLLQNIKSVGFTNIPTTHLSMGIPKDRAILRDIMDKALASIDNETQNRIINKWLGTSQKENTEIQDTVPGLTEAEKNWLLQHPTIRLGDDFAWPPFVYKNDDNKFLGIASSYTESLSRKLGINFLPQMGLTREQVIEGIKSHKLDIMPAVVRTPERETFMTFTKPYISFPIIIASRKDGLFIDNLKDLAGYRVGVVKGYTTQEILTESHPSLKVISHESITQGLAALAEGELDAFVGNLGVITYEMDRQRLDMLKIAAPTPYNFELSMGVRKDWPELVTILDKAIAAMTDQERTAIKNTWMGITVEFGTQLSTILKWVIPIFLTILAIIGLIVIWNRRMAKEILERTLMQAELVKLNQAQVFAADTARLAYWEINLINLELTFNDQCYHLLGTTVELEGGYTMPAERYFKTFVHPDDIGLINEKIQDAVKSNKDHTDQFEYRVYTRDKKLQHVFIKYNVQHDSNLKATRIMGIHLDITERKNIEKQMKQVADDLEENRAKLNAIISALPDLTLIVDEEGTYVEVIQREESIPTSGTLQDYEEVQDQVGKNVKDLLPPDEAEKFLAAIRNALDTGTTQRIDIELETTTGTRSFDEKFTPISQSISGKAEVVVVARDNTDIIRLNKELATAKEIAEAATKAKGDFLANMSHEIRTPMNAILGLNYLQQKTDLTSKQADYARKIEHSAQNLLNIINDILDFSKIEAGKIDMEEVDFNLNDVLDNLSNMMSVKAQQKDLELIVAKNTDVPTYLIGDPLRLGQILINFSTNAIKFTEKGEIVIKVEKIKLTGKSATLKFSVRDTGIGLTEEQKEKLFRSFQQADTSTTRKYGGTGLGLAISKKLVELMKGEIGVDSIPGEGSTFYFTAKFEVLEKKTECLRVAPETLQGMNVLIVDDNETVLEVLSGYCKDFTFNVQTAMNGEEALEILKKDNSIALVFIDWKMPKMDGLETSKRIKNDPKIKPTPKIIMITGYGREEIMKQAEQIGLDGFLIKPVSQSLLLDTVVEAFGETITTERATDKKKEKTKELESIRGASLLLVEDNEINQQVAVELLESEGFVVEVADDGQIAVDKISKNKDKYDLVLMDLQMPVMDGYTATKTIRQNKEFDSLPIIAMTADAMSGVEDKVRSIGMNDYISKPINVDELYKTLSKWVKPEQIKGLKEQEGQSKKAVKDEIPAEIFLPEITGIDMENGLKRVAGNKKLYRKILLQFSQSNRNFADEVLKAIENKDQDLTIRTAHTLKGVSGNLGANELFQATKKLEELLHEGITDMDAINKQLNGVNELLLPLIKEIDEFQKEQQKDEVEAEATELNIDEVKQVMADLKNNLEQYSTEASESFDKLKSRLSGHGYDMEMIELEKHINAYDFDSALELLEKLAKRLF